MKSYGKWLIRISTLAAIAGAMLGSHMADSGDIGLTPVHAHILVVGWLTLFAYGLFYWLIPHVHMLRMAKLQAICAMIGGILMPIGLYSYYQVENAATLTFFIGAASILLLALVLFSLLVFFDRKVFGE